ncbi:MAG: signal transduction histidine kinase/CheY-like chemotaxis protein [Desulforhopalus sp.]|jgi:signal transduction histidine kinase/CheY-like chemotaxis protein
MIQEMMLSDKNSVISSFKLAELVDLGSLQTMADSHFKATGMPIGLIDAFDDSVLVGAGWQDICLKFHRANPETLVRCEASDSYIKAHLNENNPCKYKCPNGLWDIGMPIVVSNQHLATMFIGQFFYEGEIPNRSFFVNQARQFNFNEKQYLDALDRVPAFSHEKIQTILDYDMALVIFIADLAEKSIIQIEERAARKKLEMRLTQSHKMESIGRLAGGIAHDFNNMIGVILGQAELSMLKLKPDSQLYAELRNIYKAADHSANLTRQLLAFARKQAIQPKVINLSTTITMMLKMLQRLVGEEIELKWLPSPNIWPTLIDPAQVDQLLINLCINAQDAISSKGVITIEVNNCNVAPHFEEQENNPTGDYVTLSVSDNGCGMDESTRSKVFEPFYTTKASGQGTGLGLATVDGITKQNNGFATVYSEPDKGTTFTIYLPSCAEIPVLQGEKSIPGWISGNETILIVEDDERLLEITSSMLESLNYTVLTANTPEKAVEIVKNRGLPIHLLLTDVIMPDMNGPELVRDITAICPDCKVLYMSGYTANVITNQGVLEKGINFIQKPFTITQIGQSVQNVLKDIGNDN